MSSSGANAIGRFERLKPTDDSDEHPSYPEAVS